VGHFYSNDQAGRLAAVREILGTAPSTNKQHDMVMYRIVDGNQFGYKDSCPRDEFLSWASQEVFRP